LYGFKRHFQANSIKDSVTEHHAKLMAFPEFSEASVKTRVLVLCCALSTLYILNFLYNYAFCGIKYIEFLIDETFVRNSGSKNFDKGGAEDVVILNAHNELYAFYTGKTAY